MTAVSSAAPPRTYTGWHRDRSDFLYGLTLVRAVMLMFAFLLAISPLFLHSLALAFVVEPPVLLLVALTFVRTGGRTANEWIGDAMRFEVARRRHETQFRSGALAPVDPADPAGPPPMDLPGTLAPLRFLSAEDGRGGQVAVVHHPLNRTYTAVARINSRGLTLSEPEQQANRVAAWGAVLASLCNEGNVFSRVQVCLRREPGDATALRRWHEDHVAGNIPQVALDNALDALGQAGPASANHNAYLVFTMSAVKARSDIKGAGEGDLAACAVLVRRVRAMEETLLAANLSVQRWLDVRDLAEVVHTGFNPEAAPALSARRVAAQNAIAKGVHTGLPAGVHPGLAGPAAATVGWKRYSHDSAVSVTWSVYEWPRSHVHSAFLAPLLAHTGDTAARRSYSMHIEPLGPREASKRLRVEATKSQASIAMMQRSGKVVGQADLMQQRQIAVQDAEQAAGHGLVRFTGYLTVTVTDPAELDRAVASVEQDAANAKIELRLLYGTQDVGFFASVLPLGSGMPLVRRF